MFVAAANIYQTQYNVAIGADLFAMGFCSSIIAVLDLFITYSRYTMLTTASFIPYQDVVVAMYIFLLVVCTTLPYMTFVPIFVDVNNGPGLEALNINLYYIFAPAISLFNTVFAGYFYVHIVGWRFSAAHKVEAHPKMLVLAYKAATHAVTSTTVTIYMAASSMHNPIQAQLVYSVVMTAAIHLLFNWNVNILERYQQLQHSYEERKVSYYCILVLFCVNAHSTV